MSDESYTMNDLSLAACFAFTHAQAVVYGPKSRQHADFVKGEHALQLTAADKRQMLARGLAELREMGIVECETDGIGDLVPKKLHEERIRAADARLVTRDLS